jgi:dsRNA-specific ribonuclease
MAGHNSPKNQHKPPVKLEDISLLSTLYFIGRAANLILPYIDKIPGNPIGTLQELCHSHHWPQPCYGLVCEEGLPHQPVFTFACYLLNLHETG